MRNKTRFEIAGVVIVAAIAAYFGAYFATVDRLDVGDNAPLYLVRYRLGPLSLDGLAPFFEPARRLDESCFRRGPSLRLEPKSA